MRSPVRPPAKPGRDDRRLEALERARDVDALAAGAGEAGARAMPVAELEVRDRQRPVDCRIEGDGDDQPTGESTPRSCSDNAAAAAAGSSA